MNDVHAASLNFLAEQTEPVMSNDAHTAAWLNFLANPTTDAALTALQTPRDHTRPRTDNPYDGANPSFLADELNLMRGIEEAHAALVCAIETARVKAHYQSTTRELVNLRDGLADMRGDYITPVIRQIEEAIENAARPGETRAAIAQAPKVL